MSDRISKLTNEVIVLFAEDQWDDIYLDVIRHGGTKQITVEQVRDFRTPFGNRMLIATLSATRVKAQSWDLKQYVWRTLSRQGWPGEMSDVLTPGKAKSYRVV